MGYIFQHSTSLYDKQSAGDFTFKAAEISVAVI